MNWLRRRPIPEWDTNAAEFLHVIALLTTGGVIAEDGLVWGFVSLASWQVALRVVDALLTPNHTSNHTQENNQP